MRREPHFVKVLRSELMSTLGVLDGEPEARDKVLEGEDWRRKITACCSRSRTDTLVIDI